jgi:hypothetical protein
LLLLIAVIKGVTFAAWESNIGASGRKDLIAVLDKKDNNAQKGFKLKWACPAIGEKGNCQNYL